MFAIQGDTERSGWKSKLVDRKIFVILRWNDNRTKWCTASIVLSVTVAWNNNSADQPNGISMFWNLKSTASKNSKSMEVITSRITCLKTLMQCLVSLWRHFILNIQQKYSEREDKWIHSWYQEVRSVWKQYYKIQFHTDPNYRVELWSNNLLSMDYFSVDMSKRGYSLFSSNILVIVLLNFQKLD